jgi:TonB family protein
MRGMQPGREPGKYREVDMVLFSSLVILALYVPSVPQSLGIAAQSSQSQGRQVPPAIVHKSESELRSEAITRIEPKYPPLARAARVFGTVVVEVTIDEEGNVISARAVMGHALLKDTSCTAARGWKFNPTRVGGKPARVIGQISFDFELGSEETGSKTDEAEATKESLLTPGEKERLRLAEEAADRFIQRWHETLDFRAVFDELYVSNPAQRRRNVYLFISRAPNNDKVRQAKGLDEALVKDGFIAFWNMYYLGQEYVLSVQHQEPKDGAVPTDIAEGEKNVRNMEVQDELTPDQIREFVVRANQLSSVYRKYLSRDVFESAAYQANYLEHSKHWNSARIEHGWREFKVNKENEVYNIRRGIFDLYFIEEGGQLRVLTLGFEL